jgi:hypothetical protein
LFKETIIEIPIKNISDENYKVKISNGVNNNLSNKVQVRIEEENFVLLKNRSKTVRVSFKMLEET